DPGRADADRRPAGLDHHRRGCHPGAGQRPRRRPGNPSRAAGELGDLPGDRPFAGRRGGGGLMTSPEHTPERPEDRRADDGAQVPVGSQAPATPAGDEASTAAEIAAEKDAARGLRPGQSAKNFWPSTKRLVREMGPERAFLALAIAVGVVSVAFSVVGPRILGRATDIILTGLISKNLPAGADPAGVIAGLRAEAQ